VGRPWSRSKVLLDGDTGFSSTDTSRVLSTSNNSGENILTSMGDEGSLCRLILKGILHRKHTVVHGIHKILKYNSNG